MQKGPVIHPLISDLRIHLGEIGWSSGQAKETWRISEDGEIRDPFRNLTYLFDTSVTDFFEYYADKNVSENLYHRQTNEAIQNVIKQIPELPFSNAWIAFNTYNRFPKECTIHFGILNSFRVWNMFPYDNSIETSCNFGGFGIDGGLSTMLGSSLAFPERLHFCVLGDLAFFYDLNSMANRHIQKNVRILLINNGKGNEFRNCIHPAYKLGDAADLYIAAAGHNGQKSVKLVKDYAENLGYKYLSADNKETYLKVLDDFVDYASNDQPILLEVFTDGDDESKSLEIITTLQQSFTIKEKIIETTRKILGEKGVAQIKSLIGK